MSRNIQINRYTGTDWEELFPKTLGTNLYATSTSTDPMFDTNNKLKEIYLPDSAFGGLTPYTPAITANKTTAELKALLISFSTITKGIFFIASSDITITKSTGDTLYDYVGSNVSSVSMQAGDWLLCGTSITASSDACIFSLINNAYEHATSSIYGIVKLSSDTQQTVAANAVTATANRSYAVQNNGSGQMVVNVPWTDTTYSTMTDTVLGLGKVYSNTTQTIGANTVTTTANRTYGIQKNNSNQLVVNVPWTDTTYTAGLGIDITNNVVTNTNVTTITNDSSSGAKTLVGVNNYEYRYTYASGITSLTLSAITSPLVDEEYAFAFSFYSGATATTIVNTLGAYFSGDDCVLGVFTPVVSKTYSVVVAWNGTGWFGNVSNNSDNIIDLSNYYTKSETDTLFGNYYTQAATDALLLNKQNFINMGTAAPSTVGATAGDIYFKDLTSA